MDADTLIRHVVHISRHWHEPAIKVSVHSEGIELECSLDDFLSGLVREIPHPIKVWTRESLERELLAGVEAVLSKIKESSAFV